MQKAPSGDAGWDPIEWGTTMRVAQSVPPTFIIGPVCNQIEMQQSIVPNTSHVEWMEKTYVGEHTPSA